MLAPPGTGTCPVGCVDGLNPGQYLGARAVPKAWHVLKIGSGCARARHVRARHGLGLSRVGHSPIATFAWEDDGFCLFYTDLECVFTMDYDLRSYI